jgi:hypothetical protein
MRMIPLLRHSATSRACFQGLWGPELHKASHPSPVLEGLNKVRHQPYPGTDHQDTRWREIVLGQEWFGQRFLLGSPHEVALSRLAAVVDHPGRHHKQRS